MKSTLALTFTLSFLLLTAVGVQFVDLASANFHVPPTPVIKIQSPTSAVNVHDVPLVIEAKVPSFGSGAGFEGIKWLNYSLDWQPSVPVTLQFQGEIKTAANDSTNPFNGDPYKLYLGKDTLTGLSEGSHYLMVNGESSFNKTLTAAASFIVDTTSPILTVHSPVALETYKSTNVTLNYSVNEPIFWAGYSLDQQANVTSRINTTLTDLSYGLHVLKVYANDSAGNDCSSGSIVFTVKDVDPPTITSLSVENSTYNSSDVSLSFNINEPVTWIGYSLDNQANVTITDNTTLLGLSSGSHSLIVYANDTSGNIGISKPVTFQVIFEEQSELAPFPTILVAAASGVTIAAVVGIGVTIFLKKRNTKPTKTL